MSSPNSIAVYILLYLMLGSVCYGDNASVCPDVYLGQGICSSSQSLGLVTIHSVNCDSSSADNCYYTSDFAGESFQYSARYTWKDYKCDSTMEAVCDHSGPGQEDCCSVLVTQSLDAGSTFISCYPNQRLNIFSTKSSTKPGAGTITIYKNDVPSCQNLGVSCPSKISAGQAIPASARLGTFNGNEHVACCYLNSTNIDGDRNSYGVESLTSPQHVTWRICCGADEANCKYYVHPDNSSFVTCTPGENIMVCVTNEVMDTCNVASWNFVSKPSDSTGDGTYLSKPSVLISVGSAILGFVSIVK